MSQNGEKDAFEAVRVLGHNAGLYTLQCISSAVCCCVIRILSLLFGNVWMLWRTKYNILVLKSNLRVTHVQFLLVLEISYWY